MPLNNRYQHPRCTAASLVTAASGALLKVGEVYLITDQSRLAVALTPSTYETFAKASEVGAGGGGYTVTTVSGNVTPTATSGENLFKVTAQATLNFPTAVGNTAKYVVKKMFAGGSVILDPVASETIDDGLLATLLNQYESVTLYSDNANWLIG